MHATTETTVSLGAERVLRDLAANIRAQDALGAAVGTSSAAARKARDLTAGRRAIEERLLARAPTSSDTAIAVAIVNAARMDRCLTNGECEATAGTEGVAPALWALIRSAAERVTGAGAPELAQIMDWYLPAA